MRGFGGTMFCNQCGHSNPEQSVFCNKCGQRMPVMDPVPHGGAPGASPAVGPSGALFRPAQGVVSTPVQPEKEVWVGATSWKAVLNGWWMLSFLLLVPILAFLVVVWFKRSTRYRITSERITIVKGIISRESDDIQLIRVEDVQFSQGVIHRLLGVGNVRVLSTDKGSPDVIIDGVENPVEFKEMLWNLVRERRRNMVAVEQLNY